MHWGHARSKDMLSWEYLPCALAPDSPNDHAGCFSGSAITLPSGEQLLMYTSVRQIERTGQTAQEQSIALGDGHNYEKLNENPVLTIKDLPEGFLVGDFRDPKIFMHNNMYYSVVVARHEDYLGCILLFESSDALSWKFVSILDKSDGELGNMWECPDYFNLNGKDVLLFSPQEVSAKGEFADGNQTAFFTGKMDFESFSWKRDKIQIVDYGNTFYAPQTTTSPDGRQIIVAWLGDWDDIARNQDIDWQGQMTIPRELSWSGENIYQVPVREIANYYSEVTNIAYESTDELVVSINDGLDFELTMSDESSIWSVKRDGLTVFQFSYDAQSQNFTVESEDNSKNRTFGRSHRGELKLRWIIDKYSVEIFIDDGLQVYTGSLVHGTENAEVNLQADAGVKLNGVARNMKF